MKKQIKSILVFVLKSALGDCTANGSTSKFESLYLYHKDHSVSEILEDIEIKGRNPEQCLIVETPSNPIYTVRCYPAHLAFKNVINMAGGNYVKTGDSNWESFVGVPYPISVHDRVESQEVYDGLSK